MVRLSDPPLYVVRYKEDLSEVVDLSKLSQKWFLSAPLNFYDLVYKVIRLKNWKLSSGRPPARETWERLQGVSENLGRVAVNKTNMADREELNFEEIHFSPIPSQTNIYGLTKIESREEGNKIFLASLSGRVVCLEYLPNSLVPTSREVPFTYIPGLF